MTFMVPGKHLQVFKIKNINNTFSNYVYFFFLNKGHNAPLYPRLSESGNELQKTLNIDSVINYWVNNGATKSKLIWIG